MGWDDGLVKATLSAGKFWGVQFYFDQIPGVIETRVGYIGGDGENPTAATVEAQGSGFTEACEISFEPDLITYDTILKHFFRIHDPTQVGGQGKLVGDQFRSVIYYHTDDQKVLAEIVLQNIKSKYKKPLVTELKPAGVFYAAADEDQKYTQLTGLGMEHVPYEPV